MSPVDNAVESMIQNLEAKTGRSLEDWITLARGAGITKQRALLMHLKAEHGLSYGYANFIALRAAETLAVAVATSQDGSVITQYGGAKAGLRPVYDVLIAAVKQFGPDVEVAPKKAYVSLRRAKQFAIIQPTRATRLDVGINLKDLAPTERLEASGSFSAMVSHRVRVSKTTEVDAELIGWLKHAYDNAGDTQASLSMKQQVVFVDVDNTLVRSAGTKRIPMPSVVKRVLELHQQGATLYLWSTGGAEYARTSAIELGIEHCFVAFLPKPDVYVDDQSVNEWRYCRHVLPGNVSDV